MGFGCCVALNPDDCASLAPMIRKPRTGKEARTGNFSCGGATSAWGAACVIVSHAQPLMLAARESDAKSNLTLRLFDLIDCDMLLLSYLSPSLCLSLSACFSLA